MPICLTFTPNVCRFGVVLKFGATYTYSEKDTALLSRGLFILLGTTETIPYSLILGGVLFGAPFHGFVRIIPFTFPYFVVLLFDRLFLPTFAHFVNRRTS